MIHLKQSLAKWGTIEFNTSLKTELEKLGVDQLPLQQGLTSSSYALDTSLSVVILSATQNADTISVKAGLFYTGMIAGCNCADDPSPIDEQNEYCEVQLEIDRVTGATTVALILI